MIYRITNLLIMSLMLLVFLTGIPYIVSKATNRPIYVQPDFRSYLTEFEQDAKKHNVSLNLYKSITVFSNSLSEGVAGVCIPKSKIIMISKDAWDRMDGMTRKAVLYHEWGHCILRREHVEEYSQETLCPVSIMYPYIDPMRSCFKTLQDSYSKELFTNPFNFKIF